MYIPQEKNALEHAVHDAPREGDPEAEEEHRRLCEEEDCEARVRK